MKYSLIFGQKYYFFLSWVFESQFERCKLFVLVISNCVDGVSVCCCVLLYYMPLGLSNGFVWQPFCLDLQNIWLLPYRENVWLPDFQRILVQVQNQCHVLSWKIKKIIYYVSSFFLGTVFGGKIRNNGALLIKGSWCNGWVKASQNQGFKISLNGGPNFYRPFLLLYFLF